MELVEKTATARAVDDSKYRELFVCVAGPSYICKQIGENIHLHLKYTVKINSRIKNVGRNLFRLTTFNAVGVSD
jgi:hypothetical protein